MHHSIKVEPVGSMGHTKPDKISCAEADDDIKSLRRCSKRIDVVTGGKGGEGDLREGFLQCRCYCIVHTRSRMEYLGFGANLHPNKGLGSAIEEKRDVPLLARQDFAKPFDTLHTRDESRGSSAYVMLRSRCHFLLACGRRMSEWIVQGV